MEGTGTETGEEAKDGWQGKSKARGRQGQRTTGIAGKGTFGKERKGATGEGKGARGQKCRIGEQDERRGGGGGEAVGGAP